MIVLKCNLWRYATGAQVAPPSLDAALGGPAAGCHHRAELVEEEGAPLVYEVGSFTQCLFCNTQVVFDPRRLVCGKTKSTSTHVCVYLPLLLLLLLFRLLISDPE
jgi:hypothetical protein